MFCLQSIVILALKGDDIITFSNDYYVGIGIGDSKVCVLMYVEDLVTLAEYEADLQIISDGLSAWSLRNNLFINPGKSAVIHF